MLDERPRPVAPTRRRRRARGAGPGRAAGRHPAGRPAGQRGRGARGAGDRTQRAGVALRPDQRRRLPQASGDDVEWVVLCSEGYTSSLAAAALLDLGLHRATDVVGGYHALKATGVLAQLADCQLGTRRSASSAAAARSSRPASSPRAAGSPPTRWRRRGRSTWPCPSGTSTATAMSADTCRNVTIGNPLHLRRHVVAARLTQPVRLGEQQIRDSTRRSGPTRAAGTPPAVGPTASGGTVEILRLGGEAAFSPLS